MYEPNVFKRLWKLGPRSLVLSYDTLAGIVAFSAVYIYTDGGISATAASGILTSFAAVSATLFAIVLTGFTIITSFTDRLFLYAWKEVGEFEGIVTTFQYNLGLPVVVLLFTLVLQVAYNPLGMIVLVAVFVYMLFALLDLVGLISRYALQRGEFVKQQLDDAVENEERDSVDQLSEEELLLVRKHLSDLHQRKQREK